MKSLVTGGAGFIGSHLVDKLIENGHEVVVVDNFYTGRKENLNPKATFYEVDITNKDALKLVFQKERPDYVFHTAAQAFVSVSTKKPEEDARINILGSIIVISLCKEFNVKKIIYTNSGGASYGNPLYMPIDEEHSINPVCEYGISKHTVDHYLYLYAHNYGLTYTSFGLANVYGPRQNPFGEGGIVAIFAHKLLKNERPTIFGDGTQVRDYCYVGDVVNACIWALDNGDNQFFNVGTGKGVTTQEISDLIFKAAESNLKPIYADERVGDAKACILKADKLKGHGWEPKMGLGEGIKKTIEFFRQKNESNNS